jgi:hypothetical protein
MGSAFDEITIERELADQRIDLEYSRKFSCV